MSEAPRSPVEVLRDLLALWFSHGEKNDGTEFPYWFIGVKPGIFPVYAVKVSEGIWFSREAAEKELENHAYRYPKRAFVWCGSGHKSGDLRAFWRLMREARKALEPRGELEQKKPFEPSPGPDPEARGFITMPTVTDVLVENQRLRSGFEELKRIYSPGFSGHTLASVMLQGGSVEDFRRDE